MSFVAAGVAVVGGGIQMYQGYKQKKAGEQAERVAQASKPEFEISQEAKANLRDAEQMAGMGLMAEQRTAAEQDIQRTTQAAMMGSADRRGGLGMVSSTAATEQRANLGLLQQDVEARRANMQQLMTVRDQMTEYKGKKFQHEYNEYAADLDYARAQVGAGMQNQQMGMNSMISGVGQGVQGGMDMARMAAGDPTAMASGSGDVTNPSAQQSVTNPSSPKAKRSIFGTDGNIFTGKKREAYNEYLDEMDNSDLDGTMQGVVSFKEFKQLNLDNNPNWKGDPDGSLSYDWRKGGGKRRIKRAMRNKRRGTTNQQSKNNIKSFFGFNTPYTPSEANTFNINL